MHNDLNEKKVNDLYLKLLKYDRIDTYFDNDDTGKKVTNYFKEIFKSTNDFSIIYEDYNDYNEYATKGRVEKNFSPDESLIKVEYIHRENTQEESKTEESIRQIRM